MFEEEKMHLQVTLSPAVMSMEVKLFTEVTLLPKEVYNTWFTIE